MTHGAIVGADLRRPLALMVLLAIVASVGLGISIAQAQGDAWLDLTISQLSADPGAAPWFRVTMLVSGVVAIALALRMSALLATLTADRAIGGPWAGLYRVAFVAIGIGFLGVGLFPVDGGPLVVLAHGTTAYAIPIAVIVLMLTAPVAVPALRGRFGRASLAALATILLLYVAAIAGVVSYAPMELAGFSVGGLWLTAFVARLEAIASC